LSGLDLFGMDSLCALAERYVDRDYFVASSARSPGSDFYSVRHGLHTPREAMELLEAGGQRILMKRPENYDPRFRELLGSLFAQVVAMNGDLGAARVVRLDGSLLVSSAAAITPYHFDPEISFFFQIAGAKIYHLFSPSSLDESELERFYVKGVLDIGALRFEGRDPAREHVFTLGPNLGMHQPQNAPHWVETRESLSVSYVFSFETDVMRAAGRTRSFNHYLRKTGVHPAPLGRRPAVDALKAGAMQVVIPARKNVGATLRRALQR
jgi:hypothetical protein